MQSFDNAARALGIDWQLDAPLDGKQVQRWGEALGDAAVRRRDAEVAAYRAGARPAAPANGPALLVIGADGGRWQGREADPQTHSRWREDKVLTVTTYAPGDGGDRAPAPLVTTHAATAGDAHALGPIARVEAERRGYRQAEVVIGMGDGGNWIDPLFDRHFKLHARVIDWCHASEHLWDCARAGGGTAAESAQRGERLEALLWDGRVDDVVAALAAESARLGDPLADDPPDHPRVVLRRNVGYFTRHRPHMDYPAYRAKGWPVGSGVTEAGVKQFNKRVKGTEQSWSKPGVESILALRGAWVSQDGRWERFWADRPAYVN